MKPTDRYDWIEKYLRQHGTDSAPASVDVLNRYFVDDYVTATGATALVMPFGANRCVQLGRDLSAMHTLGLLRRYTSGLEGLSGMGFPRWVYSYRLAKVTT